MKLELVNRLLEVEMTISYKGKIALTPLVQVSSIISDGYGFGPKDEKTYDERRMQFYNREIE